MEHDEKEFEARANRIARGMWLAMLVVFSAAYAVEVAKGRRSTAYYAMLLVCGWVPFIAGCILLKLQGAATKQYKNVLAYGFGIVYLYIMATTKQGFAFTYIFPLASMVMIYKDKLYLLRFSTMNLVIVGINIAICYFGGMKTPEDKLYYELEFGITMLCYFGYIMSTSHLIRSDGSLLGSVKDNLNRVVMTVHQVKGASSTIVDGVTVIRELSEENKEGAGAVVSRMENVAQNNAVLSEKIDSTMNMTNDINEQVGNVAGLVEHIVEISEKSAQHAASSSGQLESAVEATNSMAELSADIENILSDFHSQFERVKEETSTIEGNTSKTNLLALNASIEAARAGDAGKGFAVVAEQIRALSTETKTSSSEIQSALDRLAVISDKMLSSIGETLSLIQVTLDKIKQTSESISLITSDSTQIEDHIHIIDTAIKDVESANKQLVSNMSQVSDIVDTMTECITNSRDISSRIVSKYDESATNINTMENTIQALMCELGVGGFMGIEDIKTGMKASAILKGTHGENVEYHGTIKTHNDNCITLELEKALPAVNSAIECDMLVTVGNVIYRWENAKISADKKASATTGIVTITTRPQILNRRKYPRIDMNNHCTITVKGTDETFEGKLDNLSANGFAFLSKDRFFSNNKGKIVTVSIDNFDLPAHSVLEGQIIRCSDNDGVYIVGCQMPEDNYYIMEYVEQMIRTEKK